MDEAVALALEAGVGQRGVDIAAHRAASVMLGYLFPQEPRDAIEASGFAIVVKLGAIASIDHREVAKAWLVGNQVAAAAIRRAREDGADARWNVNDRPKAGPSVWRATPPLWIHNPVEPVAGNWKTWTLTGGGEVAAQAPPAFGSDAYWNEVREVKAVRDALTAQQQAIAEQWNLDLGTVTPPGVWNRLVLEMMAEQRLPQRDRTRVLAVLNAAMADAFIACWKAKYTWWTVRPISVIRDSMDPNFDSLVLTPAFPSYPSGHATVSGAAAAVIGSMFPAMKARVDRMAEEAALSRLYGGIHFTHDNAGGLELGRRVGALAVARTTPR